MGTRSLTRIKDEDGNTLVTIYKQYDGSFDSYGVDLAEFIEKFTVVNGIPLGDERLLANGAGCLAAQIISEFKEGAGGYYIYTNNASDCGEEYVYTIAVYAHSNVNLTAEDCYDSSLNISGTPEEFIKLVKTEMG